MHKEILTRAQEKLLPLVKKFSNDFYLVGGTAIALHLGHRHSIDFGLFTNKSFDNNKIMRQIRRLAFIERILVDEFGQLTLTLKGVQITFFSYPFSVSHLSKFEDVISLPNLITLAAMKAFALGRRPKWKDYIDLYFIFKRYQIKQIVNQAKKIFSREFNERLFRSQLAYFKDIDYSEEIDYLPGFQVKDDIIKKELIKISLS